MVLSMVVWMVASMVDVKEAMTVDETVSQKAPKTVGQWVYDWAVMKDEMMVDVTVYNSVYLKVD